MKTTPISTTRLLGATAGLGVVLCAATGCSDLSSMGGDRYDKAESYEFTNLQEPSAEQVLPSWVPEQASAIQEEQRTTGHERLIVMDVPDTTLPESCLGLKTPGSPTASEIEGGLVREGRSKAEAADDADALHRSPLLEVDWWPAGQEQETTHLCGKWWVSFDGGHLYAYSPETRVVADAVKSERDGEG
ncbi:MAG: hypothetical protein L0J68_08020 [Micrococcaceae bacterium]|nr:hypothetical protein [Micrococcaceae bacterium]